MYGTAQTFPDNSVHPFSKRSHSQPLNKEERHQKPNEKGLEKIVLSPFLNFHRFFWQPPVRSESLLVVGYKISTFFHVLLKLLCRRLYTEFTYTTRYLACLPHYTVALHAFLILQNGISLSFVDLLHRFRWLRWFWFFRVHFFSGHNSRLDKDILKRHWRISDVLNCGLFCIMLFTLIIK